MVENFSEMLESSLSDFRYKEGEIIKGTVLSIVNDTVVVDVGLKSEGRIPLKEFHSPGEDDNIKIGDEFDVYLEKLENKEGEALLSRERARKEESWSQLEKMQDKKQEIMGVITGRVKGGFAVDINGAVAVGIGLVDHVLEFGIGGVVTQRAHLRTQLLDGDGFVAILIEQREILLDLSDLLLGQLLRSHVCCLMY